MLDIKLIRENPEFVKNNLMKRGNPENSKMLKELIDLDREWRQNLTKLNELRHGRRLITAEIARAKKATAEIARTERGINKIKVAKNLDSPA
jgi:seryl-tRNA synthetase